MRNGKQETIHGVRASAMLTSGCWRRIGLLCLALAAIASPAKTEQPSPAVVKFKVLAKFDGTNGGNPDSTLVQGTDGNLYGTTSAAGANGYGNVFKITPGGSLTVLHSFCGQPNCVDGATPIGGLTLGTDGNFYGTTYYGGTNSGCVPAIPGCGTLFKITPSGTLRTLYSFCALANCIDGNYPTGLVQGTDGNFYGTTVMGGANAASYSGGAGTIFKITPERVFTTLYSFCSQPNCADGSAPTAPLIQETNGNFYGTTSYGGANSAPLGGGTVFKITPGGALTTLYSFCSQANCADGWLPTPLVQAAKGNLYGGTANVGANHAGGTVFRITPAGAFSTVYSFCAQTNCTDGNAPLGALVQARDGNLYGTTEYGGANGGCNPIVPGCGTAFRITPGGTLTTLHNFDGTDGEGLGYALVQGTNGAFYGTTFGGGTSNPACSGSCGTVFSLYVGLGSFVETLPTSGRVGETVKILGTDLTGATSVTFNGSAAIFTVVSSTEIDATVPAGATSGEVQVATPSGTLSSNVRFRVR